MSAQNKTLIQRVTEAMNRQDWRALGEVMSTDLVESLRQDPYPTAFPDYQITIDDLLVEGDKVASRWTITGTHFGEYMGIAPTKKRCTYSGISIDRIENEKVVESWTNWDEAGLLRQLGATVT